MSAMKRKALFILLIAVAAGGFAQQQAGELNEELLKAVGARNVQSAGDFLSRGANPNSMDAQGQTALYLAAEKGSLELVDLLLSKGADPNLPNINNVNNLEITKMENPQPLIVSPSGSLFAGPTITSKVYSDEQMTHGYSALMGAVKNGSLEIASLLLRKGANPNYLGYFIPNEPLTVMALFSGSWASSEENTALTLAAAGGAKARALVELLLKSGAEADCGNQGVGIVTPLMIASRDGNLELAELLIGHQANVNAKARDGETTPLDLALQERHGEVAVLLLEHGAALHQPEHLQMALDIGDAAVVEVMIRQGAAIDVNESLRMVSLRGSVALAALLLEHGAEVEGGKAGASTPLMIASGAGNYELAKMLLEKGADVNARGGEAGYTPLLLAVEGRHLQVAQLLLEKGAEPNARLMDKRTPGGIAVDYRDKTMIRVLRKHGAKIPDRFKWLFFDASLAPITTIADGDYFEGLESGYGAGVKARVYFGGIVGLLAGVSYELSQNAYLAPAYEIGFRNFSLDVGVFARLRNDFIQGYAIMASTGTNFVNGPASGKFSDEEDAGGLLSLEAGVRVKVFHGAGIALFVKKASYEYYPGPIPEEGEVLTAGLGVSYQF